MHVHIYLYVCIYTYNHVWWGWGRTNPPCFMFTAPSLTASLWDLHLSFPAWPQGAGPSSFHHLVPFHPEHLPSCLSCSSASWYLLEAWRRVSAAGLGPMREIGHCSCFWGKWTEWKPFLVAQVTSAPFPFSRPSFWSPPSSGLAMPAPALPQLLLWSCADQVVVLLVVKGHLPTAPEGPHPALPSHQGSCRGWGGHVWWGEEARRFGRRMLSPCLPSAIYISVEVSRGERELAAWWGGRGSVYWRKWNKQPNQSIRSWFKQMCQREHSEQMMLIAQCSLKSKQRANAAQWSFRRAGNGEVCREQTTEEAACSPLERGNNESTAAWKYLAIWQISVLAAAVAAFTDFFIRKNKSDDNFKCEIAGQSQ